MQCEYEFDMGALVVWYGPAAAAGPYYFKGGRIAAMRWEGADATNGQLTAYSSQLTADGLQLTADGWRLIADS
jgi:hypothetical protein